MLCPDNIRPPPIKYMDWTNLIANLVGLCAVLTFIWKGSRLIERAVKENAKTIRENALAQAKTQARSEAEKARTEALWSISEIHGELISEIQEHLKQPPEIREKKDFFVRRTTDQLEKKAFKRLASYQTDFPSN